MLLEVIDIHHHERMQPADARLGEHTRSPSSINALRLSAPGERIRAELIHQRQFLPLLRVDIPQQDGSAHIAGIRIRQHLHAQPYPNILSVLFEVAIFLLFQTRAAEVLRE